MEPLRQQDPGEGMAGNGPDECQPAPARPAAGPPRPCMLSLAHHARVGPIAEQRLRAIADAQAEEIAAAKAHAAAVKAHAQH